MKRKMLLKAKAKILDYKNKSFSLLRSIRLLVLDQIHQCKLAVGSWRHALPDKVIDTKYSRVFAAVVYAKFEDSLATAFLVNHNIGGSNHTPPRPRAFPAIRGTPSHHHFIILSGLGHLQACDHKLELALTPYHSLEICTALFTPLHPYLYTNDYG